MLAPTTVFSLIAPDPPLPAPYTSSMTASSASAAAARQLARQLARPCASRLPSERNMPCGVPAAPPRIRNFCSNRGGVLFVGVWFVPSAAADSASSTQTSPGCRHITRGPHAGAATWLACPPHSPLPQLTRLTAVEKRGCSAFWRELGVRGASSCMLMS